jgi:hypothetical protein
MKQSIYEKEVAKILTKAGYKFQTEVRVCLSRRWRWDFVLEPVETKIAIEINGGSWIGGRHNFGKGYENDLEKLNFAMTTGWIVLQYTPQTIPNILRDLTFLKEFNARQFKDRKPTQKPSKSTQNKAMSKNAQIRKEVV